MNLAEIAPYRAHTAVTDPGKRLDLFRGLPGEVSDLVALLGNVLIHPSRAQGFRPGDRQDGTELRPVEKVLDAISALDDRPWVRERQSKCRLVADCRTFAVLLCSVLRSRGIAARVRFGFASYLADTHWQSHVVCEVEDGDDWTRVDPDIRRFGVDQSEFVSAQEAWRKSRPGLAGHPRGDLRADRT